MSFDRSAVNPSLATLIAVALKVAGLIAILSALVDYIILLIPLDFGNPQWQLATATQITDRGILPLVGMALVLTSFWIDGPRHSSAQRGFWGTIDVRFWLCLLASLLSLLYLVLPVFHLSAVRLSSQAALQQVGTEASQASNQMEQRLSAELGQQQQQLAALMQNQELFNQALKSGQLPKDMEKYRNDPEGLKQFLQKQANQARERVQNQIGSRRAEAERRVQLESWKAGIRTLITSLLLAVGYAVIGWQGLRQKISG
ncbi:MAG: HpsJ family protein [Cyanobacteria bacterium REEB459]|nr:HpsJ family protein [Cyanobacteria bacterium REEB459]